MTNVHNCITSNLSEVSEDPEQARKFSMPFLRHIATPSGGKLCSDFFHHRLILLILEHHTNILYNMYSFEYVFFHLCNVFEIYPYCSM